MPEISYKELERYKRIEESVKIALKVFDMRTHAADLQEALKLVSNRPTAKDLYKAWASAAGCDGGVEVAIAVLEELKEKIHGKNGQYCEDEIDQWIEAYKAER